MSVKVNCSIPHLCSFVLVLDGIYYISYVTELAQSQCSFFIMQR